MNLPRSRRFFRLLHFVPALGYLAGIHYLSSQSLAVELPFPHADKVVHCLEFAGLTVLLAWGWWRGVTLPPRTVALLSLVSGAAYGAIDELHQSGIAGRWCSLGDWLADGLGCLVAAGSVWWWLRRRQLRQS